MSEDHKISSFAVSIQNLNFAKFWHLTPVFTTELHGKKRGAEHLLQLSATYT